jgi:hypothetical protein
VSASSLWVSSASRAAAAITAMEEGGQCLHTPSSDVQHCIKKQVLQPPTLARIIPVQCRDPVGASHHPHLVRQWQMATMAGALALGALVVVVALSHLEQGGQASFKIRGEEGCYCSVSLKISMVR